MIATIFITVFQFVIWCILGIPIILEYKGLISDEDYQSQNKWLIIKNRVGFYIWLLMNLYLWYWFVNENTSIFNVDN